MTADSHRFSRGVIICTAAALLSTLLASSPRAAQSAGASTSRRATDVALGLTAVETEIDLPPGPWGVTSVTPSNVLDQVFLVARTAPDAAPAGRRVRAAQIQRNLDNGRWRVQQFFQACLEYASTHGGVGPSAFADLDQKKWSFALQSVTQSQWSEDAGKRFATPLLFLVPAAPIPFGTPSIPGAPAPTARVPRVPLVFELRSYVDDGKHWVLFSDGSVERVPIDAARLARYNVTVSFVLGKEASAPPADATVRHALIGLLRSATEPTATVTLTDTAAGRQVQIRWALAGGRVDRQLLSEWAQIRGSTWLPLLSQGDDSILSTWLARSRDLYGGTPAAPTTPPFGPPDLRAGANGPRSLDAFSLLGGRAALRETLQIELIRPRGAPGLPGAALVPISTLKGVDVKSLPFDRMLAGKPGGRIGLADYVPADRLFVYFAKPSAVFPFLDKGGDFLGHTGSLFTASAYDDDLKNRYLRRLGLRDDVGRRFLESGEVTEMAIVAPDLFFIDGTDLTVVMRLRSADAVVSALSVLGVVDLKNDAVTEKSTASGRSTFWTRQGDLLCLSTSRRELDGVLALAKNPAGSLGRTDEFRYMLTELPPRPETRALVYLSDPFIRRMVGPALKIGQLRRMRARATMEMITAGAMLAAVDGRRDKPGLARLIELGYVPRSVNAADYTLRDDLSVSSARWGTPADMTAIDTASIDTATAEEARAYQAYMDEYRQYWRQYFDPIGMRLDDAPGGALELSTFILPLVDSQLYNQLRGFIETREHGEALRVPVVTPDPLVLVSLNLTDDSWVGISGAWSEMFSHYTGINPAIFDLIGPGLHIAVQDSDPIIAAGNADLLGAFGGATMGGGASFLESFALSVLTRPSKIFVELKDPQRAIELLRGATRPGTGPSRMGMVEFRQVEGNDSWIYTIGVPGLVTIRLGLEVKNGYLIFSNIPWSQPIALTQVEPRALNGAALQVKPSAVTLGLAGLFATEAEQNQRAALTSMASLYPLLLSGSATPEDAAARHALLFGSKPLHPKAGSWLWANGTLESSLYGSAEHWKEPRYKPELGDFGLFQGMTFLDLNMQLESGGLRAVCRWTFKDK